MNGVSSSFTTPEVTEPLTIGVEIVGAMSDDDGDNIGVTGKVLKNVNHEFKFTQITGVFKKIYFLETHVLLLILIHK